MVVFGFLPQNFGRGPGVMNATFSFYECRWEYHEVVGTFKLYLVQKNLFELFALTGDRDTWWNFHAYFFSIEE